ncbi:hypothetical protein LPN01_17355, partial [Sphingomonas sp. A2-49]|uniref:hypothetical protein n=1 Tax=Sphingomonas sp. A2-49 TaxID=1391375 RepID=UPI0021CE91B0
MDIVAGKRSLVAGGGFCVWQDEHGRRVGHGQLIYLVTEAATFKFDFAGSPNIARAAGVVTIPVRNTQRNVHVLRSSFVCQTCDGSADKLFFVEAKWACRKCHGLVYLKQRLGSVNNAIFYRDVLVDRLGKMANFASPTRDAHNQRRHLDRINRSL